MNKKSENENTDQDFSNEELILQLEKQIAAAVWLQAIGQIAEAILFTKLLLLKEETEGEIKIAAGVWVQSIGQIIEALGVTKEIAALDKTIIKEAQKMTIIGSILQSAGAAIEAIGGTEVLLEDDFIP